MNLHEAGKPGSRNSRGRGPADSTDRRHSRLPPPDCRLPIGLGHRPAPDVLVDEWRKDGRTKTPYFTHLRSGRPFGFADIWSTRRSEVGNRLVTCAIVTCPPNELMATIHDRMPVILPVGAPDRWLDPTAAEGQLRELLVPLPVE